MISGYHALWPLLDHGPTFLHRPAVHEGIGHTHQHANYKKTCANKMLKELYEVVSYGIYMHDYVQKLNELSQVNGKAREAGQCASSLILITIGNFTISMRLWSETNKLVY